MSVRMRRNTHKRARTINLSFRGYNIYRERSDMEIKDFVKNVLSEITEAAEEASNEKKDLLS